MFSDFEFIQYFSLRQILIIGPSDQSHFTAGDFYAGYISVAEGAASGIEITLYKIFVVI